MICLYKGPGPLAQLVRDELLARGVGADLRYESFWGSMGGRMGLQSVITSEEVFERHGSVIDEVLAMVSEQGPSEEGAPDADAP